jgi:hypothetical protein
MKNACILALVLGHALMTYSVAIESVGYNFAWPLNFWVLESSKFSM